MKATRTSVFSLAGLPIFAGFASKFYLFNAAAAQGLLWIVGLAIFMSLVSLYYYLQIVRQMYIEEPTDRDPVRVAGPRQGSQPVDRRFDPAPGCVEHQV